MITWKTLSFEPGSKLPVLGMVIQPLIGNPYNGYINPYYWVDDHPLLYGNNGSWSTRSHIWRQVATEAQEFFHMVTTVRRIGQQHIVLRHLESLHHVASTSHHPILSLWKIRFGHGPLWQQHRNPGWKIDRLNAILIFSSIGNQRNVPPTDDYVIETMVKEAWFKVQKSYQFSPCFPFTVKNTVLLMCGNGSSHWL